MSHPSRKAQRVPVKAQDIRFIAADVIHGPSGGELETADGHAISKAAGVARLIMNGQPTIIVTLVDGGVQTTLTMDVMVSDAFCHMLADAVQWQNRIAGLATCGRPN